KPCSPSPWEGVRKCVRFGPRAPQADFFWERLALGRKSEDCLYLNVFSPVWKPENDEDGHAVMVYVHGGGFLIDSAVRYGDQGIAKYLCRHGVVVVTIQYRLALLGFLSTGDEVCAGNLGLWDMTLALHWVQDNIRFFDGDPERVTVFGQSAGGASVDMLALSPHSRGNYNSLFYFPEQG
ncbi:COesterase domain-containing protein, partial [Trichostrongylus colubriformis]